MKKFKFVIICGLIFILIGAVVTGAAYQYGRSYPPESPILETYAQNFDIDATNYINICNIEADIYIERGERFSVVAENMSKEHLVCEMENNILVIRMQKDRAWFNIGFIKFSANDLFNPTSTFSEDWTWGDSSKIYIYIPEGAKFNEVSIFGNLGNITAGGIECDRLYIGGNFGNIKADGIVCDDLFIDGSVGNISIDNFSADTVELNGGLGNADLTGTVGYGGVTIGERVGNTTLNLTETADCDINIYGGMGNINVNAKVNGNVELNGGVGNLKWDGAINGDVRLQGGMGDVNLNLAGNLDDYNIYASKGLGSIRLNGTSVEDNYNQSEPTVKNNIEIRGGVGDIKLNIK